MPAAMASPGSAKVMVFRDDDAQPASARSMPKSARAISGAAAAHQPAEADHLAGAHAEAHVGESPGARQAFHREDLGTRIREGQAG